MNRRSALITLGGMGALGILGLSSKARGAGPTPIKVVVVGSSQVGKTCLLIRLATNDFPGEYIPKVYENYSRDLVVDGKSCRLGLWDIGSTADYDRLRPLTYPQTDVFLACFSITDPQSFDDVKTKWVPEVTHHCPGTPIILVGTKGDLRGDRSKAKAAITKERAEEFLKEIKAVAYAETSAKTGLGVTAAFEVGARAALAAGAKTKAPAPSSPPPPSPTPLPKPTVAPTAPLPIDRRIPR